MAEKDADMIISVIRSSKDSKCGACNAMETLADCEGADKHVLYIEATVDSVMEKKLNKVTDSTPFIQVITKEEMK